MALPTTSVSRFVGPIYVGNTPPSTEELGKPVEAGMVYVDSDGSDVSLCVYNGSAWDCVALTAAQPTTTSTTTTA